MEGQLGNIHTLLRLGSEHRILMFLVYFQRLYR